MIQRIGNITCKVQTSAPMSKGVTISRIEINKYIAILFFSGTIHQSCLHVLGMYSFLNNSGRPGMGPASKESS